MILYPEDGPCMPESPNVTPEEYIRDEAEGRFLAGSKPLRMAGVTSEQFIAMATRLNARVSASSTITLFLSTGSVLVVPESTL